MNSGPREWDAQTYDQISEPQYQWGLEVLDRLDPQPNEAIVDAGCGSGRVTEKLLERLPDGRVVGVDGSAEMIKVAAEKFSGDDRVTLIVSDLLDLSPELLEANGAPAAWTHSSRRRPSTGSPTTTSSSRGSTRCCGPVEGWSRSAGERGTSRSTHARSRRSQRSRSTSTTSRA